MTEQNQAEALDKWRWERAVNLADDYAAEWWLDVANQYRRLVREDVRPELRDTIREINVRLGNCDPLEDATRPELDEGFDDRSYLASTDEMLDRLEADMVEESPTPDEARSSARTSPGADGRQAPTPTVNVPHVVYDQKMPPYHYQKPEFGSGSVSAPTQPEPAQEPDEVFSELARHIWNDGGLLNTSIIKEILANLPSLLRTPEAIAEIKRQGWVEASVVEAERENIVAWLRDQSRDPMLPEYAEFLSAFVDAIECGEHRKLKEARNDQG